MMNRPLIKHLLMFPMALIGGCCISMYFSFIMDWSLWSMCFSLPLTAEWAFICGMWRKPKRRSKALIQADLMESINVAWLKFQRENDLPDEFKSIYVSGFLQGSIFELQGGVNIWQTTSQK